MSNILTVSELTRSVKNLLEAEFPFVWVRGQVTNLARPASGHVYFTLSDGDAALSVVWFKSSQMSSEPVKRGGDTVNPLTGEIEEEQGGTALSGSGIEDGMEVLCAGRLNVYEPRGQYQLVAELVQSQGVGDLAVAFEALKKKLAAKGYFDEDRKLALPRDPRRVAVITSRSGAAIRDFLRIAETRGTGAEIRIYPCLVQGERAPWQIAEALDQVDAEGWAEVAVLIRGGGSLEDLWAFNTEEVADAIYRARLPVITGVGHEPDVSIADFVADKRAATPSHAAQELWPRRETLAQKLDVLDMGLNRAYGNWLSGKDGQFENLRKAMVWLSPKRRLERMEDRFSALMARLQGAGLDHYYDCAGNATQAADRLDRAFGPERLDNLGRDVAGVAYRLSRAFGPSRVEGLTDGLSGLSQRLDKGAYHAAEAKGRELALLETVLRGLDPEAPLERGYALVQVVGTGKFLRDPKGVTKGDALDIRVRDGRVAATVTDTKPTDA
ncbi:MULTISPECIES: exodeoxyribonuclease VII large subunit [unclassified Pseudodesulfovibrio]|uniref:exodeoxyribonuclease VII large subunit n=1 Tax=unclassified Pseudodesulfovibrio TaxID=2661612 RepID=UPI000FEBF43F|nr:MULTISPECIES: exodeoxyribonuclease VII large subunit [unclassified Pseudodesulfovibrio]MCJ2164483.1 exodeoxyribonuclease VII large subunit [Pseudodesulfovibrio sp. S3-i]RWU04683.1 exodeoxyribonuclease VII large subunit [Pseudodesulfovibrio sp. S3]